jgi:PAS domain S-box-containing protein
MRFFFQRSLLTRIVLSFFLLSSIIVVFLTAMSYVSLVRSARQQRMDQISAIAEIKVATLSRWVDEQTRDSTSLARSPQLNAAAAVLCATGVSEAQRAITYRSLSSFIAETISRYPEFHAVSVLSAEGGRIVFSTDTASIGQYRVLDSGFVEGMKGVSVQRVHPSPITLDPTMSISSPLKDGNGAVFGVVDVQINLDFMDRIIQDRTGLGRTGEAYLVDRYNTFVSAARFGRESYPRGVHSSGIDTTLKGVNGTGSYLNYAGVPVIGAYRWIGDMDLALLVEIHQEEAFRTARMQALLLVALGLALVLVLASGVFFLARRLARPILAIQQAALRVTGGDLDATAPVLTGDEVGALARSFNRMTSTVKGLYEELRGKEKHFRSLIESSMDIVAIFDSDGLLSFVSPSAESITGYPREELHATNIATLVHPEDQPGFRAEIARLMREPDAAAIGVVARIVRKDGSVRSLEANMRNLLENAAIKGFVVNARDVTERRQLEDKLLQAQKMEAIGRLAGGVAHDFNNLLTVVIGYSDTIAVSEGLPDEVREYVDEIEKAAKRAAELTQQLLAYSRKQVLQPSTIDFNSLLAGMSRMLERLIGEDVRIVLRTAEDLMSVRADPSQISQVIMNLAANARDAMPTGGTIVFETGNVFLDDDYCLRYPELVPGEYAMLAVIDTGCGMTEEVRNLVFDPFFTTKGLGKGTGLGLATVYGIVKQSSGHITVQSDVGKGSTFRIYLPVTSEKTDLAEGSVEDKSIPSGVGRVLVVEDEEPLRRMICLILGQAGYLVEAAGNAEEAVPLALGLDGIDLLVSDVILPGENGREMAETILRLHPDMKVLFISGYTESVVGQKGALLGGVSFLQKPFSPAVFSRKVREVLDNR